jgi:PAS domain S-box-containing protein
LAVSRIDAAPDDAGERLELFETLAENIPGTVYLCRNDPKWSMLYLHDSVECLTGHRAAEFIEGSVSFVDLYHADDAVLIGPVVENALEARLPYHLIYRVLHADGSERWVEEHGQGVWNANGELTFLVGTLFDITEHRQNEETRKGLERQLLQSQKLESLGVLAGGIAHDFNNLLTGLMSNVELATLARGADDPGNTYLEEAKRAGQHAASLTRQLLAYAGRGLHQLKVLDLAEHVRDTEALLGAAMPKKTTLELTVSESPTWIFGDPAQIQQVVLNLVLNACEALGEDSGTVRVRLNTVELSGPLPDSPVLGPLLPGRYVVLEVQDDGRGMSPETQRRIFDPFFSTKRSGHGLGLAAVLGIVRALEGHLTLVSEQGEGTTFRVYLPASEAPDAAAPATSDDDVQGSERILVVDDEAAVLRSTQRLLETFGYEVTTASDGLEATRAFAEIGDQIDLVVLDMSMPGLSGHEVFKRVRELRADIPVLFCSGYHRGEEQSRLSLAERVEFLEKPFTVSDLLEKARALLDS